MRSTNAHVVVISRSNLETGGQLHKLVTVFNVVKIIN
jgi:hypothetical protein